MVVVDEPLLLATVGLVPPLAENKASSEFLTALPARTAGTRHAYVMMAVLAFVSRLGLIGLLGRVARTRGAA